MIQKFFFGVVFVVLFGCTPAPIDVPPVVEIPLVERFGTVDFEGSLINEEEGDEELIFAFLEESRLPLSCASDLYPAVSFRWDAYIYLPMADFVGIPSLLYQRFDVFALENLKFTFAQDPIFLDGFFVYRSEDKVVFAPSPVLEGIYPVVVFDWALMAHLIQPTKTSQVLYARNAQCFSAEKM